MRANFLKAGFLFVLYLYTSHNVNAQQMSYIDPAQAYNRLVLEKNAGVFRVIDNYKVIGSPYLYGDMYNGQLFEGKQKGDNLSFKYNVYDQTLEILTTARGQYLIKSPLEIDSFYFSGLANSPILTDLKFVSSKLLDKDAKPLFLQAMVIDTKYSLYKSYTVTLGVVPHAYLNADQRQFDLNADYYYIADDAKEKVLKKLKLTKTGLTKEFKDLNIDQILRENKLSLEPEVVLNKIFYKFNNQQ